jgi:hypothetical protein
VSSEKVLELVVIEELFYSIRAELDDISSAVRVSDEIGLDTELLIVISRI